MLAAPFLLFYGNSGDVAMTFDALSPEANISQEDADALIAAYKSGKLVSLDKVREERAVPASIMAQITVYSDGEGTLWIDDSMVWKEQFNWLLAKIAEISGAILREKGERSGEV